MYLVSVYSEPLLNVCSIIGGPLNLYHNQNFCMHLGINADNAKDQCTNGFASFLALLESIPFDDAGSNNGSFEYSIPDRRYISFLYSIVSAWQPCSN